MVDSIIFRIYDLQKHEKLADLLNKKGIEGQSSYIKQFDNPELAAENLPRRIHIQRWFKDHQTGRDYEAYYKSFLKSLHYSLSYFINYQQGFMEFNFSIPKYLYGTNILQFVPHHFDPDYREAYFSDLHKLGGLTFKRLTDFMRWFFNRELNGLVDPTEVRFMRVDICYNKIFNSKEEAFYYLSEIKRIKKKFLRDTSKGNTTYHTGIYYPSKEHTLKIYHKGSEFRNNDRPKIDWMTDQQLEFYQSLADRILRYEVEFRHSYMDRIFKSVIFRPKAEYWKIGCRLMRQIAKDGYATIKGKKVSAVSLPKEYKLYYKYARFISNKTFNFMAKSESDFAESDYPVNFEDKPKFSRYQAFGSKLFGKLYNRFKRYFDEFTPTFSDDFVSVLGRIENTFKTNKARSEELRRCYNLTASEMSESDLRNISFSKAKHILNSIRQNTWDEISKAGFLSPRTYYRYKKFFKAFGIGEVASEKKIAVGTNGFQDYYDELNRNNHTINMKGLFRAPF